MRMARHTYLERADAQDGAGAYVVIPICIVLLIGIVALFTVFGGPGRFLASPVPPATNVNGPAQGQSRSGMQAEIPGVIDVKVHDAPAAASH